jgi:excisionase family DNA binding protein
MTLLTVNEAAAELRVHPETIRRLIRRGELDATKVGSVWRVPAGAIDPPWVTIPAERAPRAVKPGRETSHRVRARRAGRTGGRNA